MKTRSVTVAVPAAAACLLALASVAASHPASGGSKIDLFLHPSITVVDPLATTTALIPEVIVYVDENGAVLKTTTETIVITPSTILNPAQPKSPVHTIPPAAPAAPAAPRLSEQEAAAATPMAEKPKLEVVRPKLQPPQASTQSHGSSPPTRAAAPHVSDPSPKAAPSAPTPNMPSRPVPPAGHAGIAYSPYTGDGGCKTQGQVTADLGAFAGLYGFIRLYGTDCNQVALAYGPAKQFGLKLFLGIFSLQDLGTQVGAITSVVGKDWGIVHTVSVGNELVNSGQASVGQVQHAVAEARQLLRAAGYRGPVVTVDTFMAVKSHPELCDSSDYCAVNVHPFFNPTVSPAEAGPFVVAEVAAVRSRLSDPAQPIIVTETGWPWRGSANGNAVPGLAQQGTALQSIRAAFSGSPAEVIFFTAYNDMWKKAAAATFDAEQFWGVGGAYGAGDGGP